MRCTETENLNACSQHWPIERAQFFSRQCPTACRTANTSTGEWIGVQSFASSSICAQSCPTLCDPMDCSPPVGCPYDFPCKNTEVSCHFLLQGIFLTQELNLRLLSWQAVSLALHQLGSPIFTWTLANWLPLLQASQQLVAEKRLPQPEETEKSFQEFFKTRSIQFYATGMNKLIFHWGEKKKKKDPCLHSPDLTCPTSNQSTQHHTDHRVLIQGVITICQGFHYQELEGFHGSYISWPDENWIGNLWST